MKKVTKTYEAYEPEIGDNISTEQGIFKITAVGKYSVEYERLSSNQQVIGEVIRKSLITWDSKDGWLTPHIYSKSREKTIIQFG